MSIKLMSYNLGYGLHDNSSGKPVLDERRAIAAQALVRAESPTVLGLVEACFVGANKYGLLMDYGKLFGYDHVATVSYGDFWGNALLSRIPFSSVETVDLCKTRSGIIKRAIRSTMSLEGKLLHVDVVHPTARVPCSQNAEAMRSFFSTGESPRIAMGDFNAVSDDDAYDPAMMIEAYKPFAKDRAEEYVRNLLECKTVPMIKAAGFRDTLPAAKRTFTIPTDMMSLDKRSAARIDYIFATKDIRALDGDVVKGQLANEASDHYPVTAIIDV